MILVMMLLNGTAEANVGVVSSMVTGSRLSSLVFKPVVVIPFVVSRLVRNCKLSRVIANGGIAQKISTFIKDNARGLLAGVVISGIWNKPEKTKSIIQMFYSIIPFPLRVILLVIVVGYLSPYIAKALRKFKMTIKENFKYD